jgi:wyosine [tRNA(Phe)-imidazoG37] synthetase (radical SAM superfamily)
MSVQDTPIVFGPVPSRRLGRSLGINNIPPKACSYACIYCQVGPTRAVMSTPREFYPVEVVVRQVADRVHDARRRHEQIDYLTFVPDGEPTLDVHLAETIRALRPLGIPIAVISNGSLCWHTSVREALAEADWVSVKVDAADEPTWRHINRPAAALEFNEILDGVRLFASQFQGELCSETMLVGGVNDSVDSVERIAAFLAELSPSIAYLAVPTRPPTLASVRAPSEETVNRAFQLMDRVLPRVEYLIGYEGDRFAGSGDARSDLLSVTAVHPMRRSAVRDLLERSGSSWDVVDALVTEGSLRAVEWEGHRYYVRRFRST